MTSAERTENQIKHTCNHGMFATLEDFRFRIRSTLPATHGGVIRVLLLRPAIPTPLRAARLTAHSRCQAPGGTLAALNCPMCAFSSGIQNAESGFRRRKRSFRELGAVVAYLELPGESGAARALVEPARSASARPGATSSRPSLNMLASYSALAIGFRRRPLRLDDTIGSARSAPACATVEPARTPCCAGRSANTAGISVCCRVRACAMAP
jgi:hypothetical protein